MIATQDDNSEQAWSGLVQERNMNFWGKVLAWLVVFAGLGATYCTAKLIQVRNSWTAKLAKATKQYEELAPKVRDAKAELERQQEELHRATTFWGPFSDMVPTQIADPAGGKLQINIGKNVGLKEGQWLYGFELQPDGTSIYRGDFSVETALDAQSLMRPNFRVRPEEIATWKGANWRWRTTIPATTTKLFDDMELALVRADELLGARRQTLQIQDKLIAEAKDQHAQRIAELIGGDQLPQDEQLATEYRAGLVAAVEESEELRNGLLIEVDRLRRELLALQQDVDRIKSDNVQSVGKLPQPAPSVAGRP
ncbi:hypothetical protein [Planctellipticum variicoloris]|uniref:hypothetical protein n=1 Tax=Planctellipticum variicoloris TaxID=3064265 RepID=UPI002C561AD9|nr:hypothetical protein SH412_001663 [Planctomycetaceae bacterium SH412]HTN02158.1 hypothetical protein [Planctomycetaceae bacterium]